MEPPALDFRNPNALWCSVLAETLARLGVRHAVCCPGSRSTPLTFAFAAHAEITAIPVLDERSAAFFALGLARGTHRPVALVCTSGSATANFLPAVVEAAEGGVPLLVLTADRPPEMRACASGQTIEQPGIYGRFARWAHEFAVPAADEARLRYLRQTLLQAFRAALADGGGPVHLNAPFRDPLPPLPDDGSTEKLRAAVDWHRFFHHVAPVPPVLAAGPVPRLNGDAHGVIVVGPAQPADPAAWVTAVGEIARRLGWPVLTDGLSPLRHHAARVPQLVTAYHSILRDPATAERLKPEVVLALGDWPTSKVLRAWLEASGAEIWQLTGRADNRDALHGATRALDVSLPVLASALPPRQGENGYARMWLRAEERARPAIDAALTAAPGVFEGRAVQLLARHLPPGTPVCVASSMPVRDVEYFWPASDRGHAFFCNRGANGIDGTLSTALGVAQGAERPAVLLTGDLAFLHDANGLLLRPKFRGSLTVVLIDNRGGGIFEHLPVAKFDPPFEEFFATPQAVEFSALCAAHGAEYHAVRDWAHFTELVGALPAAGLRVLHVRTDRKADAATRKAIFDAATAAVAAR